MPVSDSRYAQVRKFAASSNGRKTFDGLRGRETTHCAGVVEHVVAAGDRLDLLAIHYYNDPTAWWRILDANPQVKSDGIFSLEALIGNKIVIPSAAGRTRARGA